MLFESTRILLRNIVQSIENGDSATWDDHLESGIQCLYELHQMSRPASRSYKIDAKSQSGAPVSDRAVQAIPHVKLMVGAIRRKDQSAAIQAGRAAVVEMNGFGAPKAMRVPQPIVVAVPVIVKTAVVIAASAPAPVAAPARRKKPAPKARKPILKSKPKKLARAAGR